MNENDDEVSIPLTVDTEQARANINGLREDAQALDDTLLELRQRGTEVFNQAPEGKQRPARSYDEVEQRTSQYAPDLYAQQNPEMARIQAGIAARQDAIDARLRDFVQARPDAATLSGGAFYQAYGAWSETAPPTPPATSTLGAPAPGTPTPPATGAAWPATFMQPATAPPSPPAIGGGPAPASPTSGLAPEALTRLRGDAEALDPDLQKRETQATRLFNALKMPGPSDLSNPSRKPLKADDYDDVRTQLATRTPEDVWALSPALHQAVMGAEDRRATISSHIDQFAQATTAPAPESVPTGVQPAPLAQSAQPAPLVQPAPLAQPAQPAPGAQGAQSSAPADVYRTFSAWLAQQQQASSATTQAQGRSSTTTGGIGAGNTSPFALGGGTTAQDTDRTATTFADKMASALTRSGGSVAAGLTRGAFDAAGMGAAGDVVSGLARPVAGALGELFAPVAGMLAAVGVGLGINAQSSHYFAEEQTLAGGVGSRGGATPSSELTTAQQTGWGYLYHEKESVAAARQLGDAGVDSSQLGGTLSASMALARVGGMDLGATTQLSGQYARAGLSGSQISDTYAEMDQASRLTGVSLSRVTAALKELNQTAGLGAIGVTSLVATQALAGPEINVGQALAPAIGAQGSQAIQMSAILGMTEPQFLAAQKNPAALWDAYAGVAKRFDKGSYGIDVAEQALQTAGLDLSSLKGPDAAAVVQRLVSQGPKAAEDYYTSLQTKEKAHPETGADLTNKGKDVSNRIIAAGEKFVIDAERASAALIRGADALGHTGGANEVKHWQLHHPGQRRAESLPGATLTEGVASHLPRESFTTTNALTYETPDNHTKRVTGYVSGYRADTRWVDPRYVTPHAIAVDNTRGSTDYATPQVTGMVAGAAQYTHVPIGVSLALLARETDIKNVQGHGDGGYGIAQWDFSTQANQRNAMHYLGASSVAQAKQYAMDPQRAITASDTYLRDIYNDPTRGAHNWERTLASYNGSGPAAQQYGHDTYQAAQKVEIQIGGTVTLTHPDGKPAGTGQVKPQTHTIHHPVNHARKATAAASYAPTDHTPPAPPPRFHRFG